MSADPLEPAEVERLGRERPGLAVLGCGAAADLHTPTLAAVAPNVLRFYASRDAGRARATAERHRGVGWFEGYEAALADERVDVALVLTPPSSHLEWTLAALRAGKHVVVEKPPFLSSRDLDIVAAAARSARRRVLVAENYPYKPLTRALAELLRSGRIGETRLVQITAVKRQPITGWRGDPALAGGGALFEGGIHWISLLTELDDDVASVGAVVPDPMRPERTAAVHLRWASGALATLAYSWEVHAPLRGLRLSRVYGSEGSAVFESNGLFLAAWGRGATLRVPGLRDIRGHRAMWRDFLAALREGRPPLYHAGRARRDLELVEEAYRGAGMAVPDVARGPDRT